MRKVIHSLVFAAAATFVTPGIALAQDETLEVRAPALVLAISVDQLSADIFAQYRRNFTGGLARLQQGAVFPSGFQSHAATETCPGHSTILTGVRPARSGIVANWWFDPAVTRKDKRIYCAEDESDPQSSSRNPVVSAVHLQVPTLGSLLKARYPDSRNVALAGKDRSAMMMGGKDLDVAYWWKGAGFATFKGLEPGPAAAAINSKLSQAIALGVASLPVPAWCDAKNRAVPVGKGSVGDYTFAIPPGQARIYGMSPHQDAAVADLAIGLVDEQQLGRDASPDVLSVGFSATDYIGHAFGTQGAEMCIQLAQLDQTIGKLFDALDARGIDYVAVLTADHGGIDTPERLNRQGYSGAQRLSAELQTAAIEKTIREMTGVQPSSGPLIHGGVGLGDIYISRGLSGADKAAVLSALTEHLRGAPQVVDAFTFEELAVTPIPGGSPQDWSLRQRARASFHQDISGDLTVMLARGVVPFAPRRGLVTTHGSPWDYDRRVPILFWRKGLTGLEQPAPVETVDIAPTLAAMLGLDVAEGIFDGRCLDIDGGVADICA
ncbi:MAG: alkaline phosphatase family protein [Sphingomonadaceae bacterium]|nr:alkaline phosphatase family protein [Sphingomonadaceae bacterium]